MEIVDTNNWVR